MNVESAAALLDERLRPFAWYISTGIGETADGAVLFVYVKARKPRLLADLDDGWNGYRVQVRVLGTVHSVEGRVGLTA